MARRKTEQPHKDPVEREPWTPWGKWAKRRRERKEQKRLARIQRKEERTRRRQLARMRRRRFMARGGVFIGLFGIGLVIAFIVLTVLGRPYPWEAIRDVSRLQQIQLEITQRRARWQSLSIEAYKIEVFYEDNADVACGPALIEVEDGEVVDMPDDADENWSRECSRMADAFTVEAAFERLEQEINGFEASETMLDARFNQDFGYLTLIESDRYDERVDGCCWIATWSDMQPE